MGKNTTCRTFQKSCQVSNLTPTNIRLLCVGISEYQSPDFERLPCALNDASEFFQAFHRTFGAAIENGKTWLLTDITAAQFLCAFNLLTIGARQECDLLVVFFSGHAKTASEVLEFLFIDAPRREGVVSTVDISETLRKRNRPTTLLILDCCYAGHAADMVNSGAKYYPHRSYVVAGSGLHQPAKPGETLSVFTQAFVSSLLSLAEQSNALKLDDIVENTQMLMRHTGQEVNVYRSPGIEDIVLREVEHLVSGENHFLQRFCGTLNRSTSSDRETLLYSLAEFREHVSIDVAERWLQTQPAGEALWRVRRALGSSLNSGRLLTAERRDFCQKALGTRHFPWETVAIIAARNDLTSDDIIKMFVSALTTSSRVDTQWLAYLYLADAFGSRVLEMFSLEKSRLIATQWGVCELFEHATNKESKIEIQLEALNAISSVCEAQLQQVLINYVALMRPELYQKAYGPEPPQYEPMLQFAQTQQRGKGVPSNMPKWVYSKMYGSWRGHLILSATNILSTLDCPSSIALIEAIRLAPAVQVRMGIFEALSDVTGFNQHEAAAWGFIDPHPWVRRAALEWVQVSLAKGNKILARRALEKADLTCDANQPGRLDLLFEYARLVSRLWYSGDGVERFKQAVGDLTPMERTALSNAMQSERISFREEGHQTSTFGPFC